MAMPNHLVLVRHGQSEANVVQKQLRTDPEAKAPEGFFDRHNSFMRLSELGERQAIKAGEWLRLNDLNTFDRYYVSPHIRTRETAANLTLNGTWLVDDRWREREWGEYGMLNDSERLATYALSRRLKDQHSWYWTPPGGESLATGVRHRFEDVLDTLHRETAEKKVLAVTHGEMITVARFVLERLTPEELMAQEAAGEYPVKNGQILHYTRIDPESGKQSTKLQWRRSICPWNNDFTWNEGEWTEITPRRYSDAELLETVENHTRLFAN